MIAFYIYIFKTLFYEGASKIIIFDVKISQMVKGDRTDRQILPQQFAALLPSRLLLRTRANTGKRPSPNPQYRHHSHRS